MQSPKLDSNFAVSFRGFFFACEYLLSNEALMGGYAMTNEELKVYMNFPNGRREDFIAIIYRANKLRNEAHRKAMVISELQ